MTEQKDRIKQLVREAEQKAAIRLCDQGARVYSSLAPPGYPRQPERQPGSPRHIGVLLGDAAPPFTETERREPIMDQDLADQILQHDPQAMADLAMAMEQPVRGRAPAPFRDGTARSDAEASEGTRTGRTRRTTSSMARTGGLAPASYQPVHSVTTAGVPDEPFEPGPIPTMGIQIGEPPEEQPNTYALMLMGVTDRIAFVREFRRIRPEVGLNAAMNIVRNMPSELILTQQQAHRLANVGASFINSSEFVEGALY